MKNYVITITRTCGSGGAVLGKLLAEDLEINYYDRKLLCLASDDSGINEHFFASADEHMKKSILFKASQSVYNGELIPPESPDFTSNDNLFNYQAKVLKELTKRESFIVIGRAADYILRDYPYLVRVFVHAPMETCTKHQMEWLDVNTRKAELFIKRENAYHSAYYKYHTGREWKSAEIPLT